MKRITLLCVISFVVVTLSAQSTRKFSVIPTPLPQPIVNIEDISTMLYKIEGIRYRYEFTYDQFGNLSQELYTDLEDANYSFKCTYTYDANQNMLKRNLYSWLNNVWVNSSYEEFAYNEQNQRVTHTNANDMGEGVYYDNIAGKLIQQETMNDSNVISMSNFSSGIYVVKVYNDRQMIAVQKVVTQ